MIRIQTYLLFDKRLASSHSPENIRLFILSSVSVIPLDCAKTEILQRRKRIINNFFISLSTGLLLNIILLKIELWINKRGAYLIERNIEITSGRFLMMKCTLIYGFRKARKNFIQFLLQLIRPVFSEPVRTFSRILL